MSQSLLDLPSQSNRFAEIILTNARLVLADGVLDGTVVIRDGIIAEIDEGFSRTPSAIDLVGDFLIPGIIDLHTDNLERQSEPRPGARWPSRSALLAHDAQCAAAAVTTVFDALCLGDLGLDDGDRVRTFREGVANLEALAGSRLLKAGHFLHLRCELPAADMPDLLESVADHALVRMASLMDHTPGVGQYADVERYRSRRARGGMAVTEIDTHIARLQEQRGKLRASNRRFMLNRLHCLPIVLASHDDETVEEVAENHADGIRVSEFPVRLEAALAAHGLGMDVIAGAPNLVRGGSHSGNVSAAEMLTAGAVDALASDYVPPSLLEAVFRLAAGDVPVHEAVALVTANPARIAGLSDRGRIAPGLRADLAAVHTEHGLAAPMAVWRGGRRIS
ncbi:MULTISPECIES: alpha-D-ribose 1-methylphosphonate 5-triphosphate diphosphatase [unclassified Acidisoma]|jgi:alpha-D-ribose 1-methylphosphonate 5-triphosphate diphosphatase|uniref:alpha-D-ribose 1-methylphosphonate 5-triphosphate diphosphatase n=1 Tax=unclassified Acidisoma TaxID=2634065 RepID=UPI00131CB6E5|nr:MULTISPECIES: alpha-D-ribose 1-methylphosphonate 5-triphosphate diphosphatase [unclassified Acidisoma]